MSILKGVVGDIPPPKPIRTEFLEKGKVVTSICNLTSNFEFKNEVTLFECEDSLSRSPTGSSSVEINLKIHQHLLQSKAPVLKTFIEIENSRKANRTCDTYMDVIVHTDNGHSSVWSYGKQEEGKVVSQQIYMPTVRKRENQQFNPIKIVLFPTVDGKLKFNISVELKDISIKLEKPETVTLTPFSPVIFRFDHVSNEPERIRIHTTRADANIKHVKQGCAIVAIQRLDKPFHFKESDISFKSWFQTMMGRSVIDVDVGPKTGLTDGFYIVILRKHNDTDCINISYHLSVVNSNDRMQPTKSDEHQNLFNCGTERDKNDDVKMKIHVTRIDYDVTIILWIIVGILSSILMIQTAVLLINKIFPIWDIKSTFGIHGIALTGTVRTVKDKCSISFMCLKHIRGCLDLLKQHNGNFGTENPQQISKEFRAYFIEVINSSSFKDDHDDDYVRTKMKEECIQEQTQTRNSSMEDCDDDCGGIKKSHKSVHEANQNQNSSGNNSCNAVNESKINDGIPTQGQNLHREGKEKIIKNALNIGDKKSIMRIVGIPEKRTIRKVTDMKGLKLSDLAMKCDPTLYAKDIQIKSDMYGWIMMLTGVFYLLPVVQLMLGAQNISNQTGNQDLCYYNYLCRHATDILDDYGHVYSNIAYIFSGMCFILATLRRRQKRRKAMLKLFEERTNKESKIDNEIFIRSRREIRKKIKGYSDNDTVIEFLNKCGIPEQYGMYYAMGIATIFEGICSACYHVCPTKESFQFDTTYMYILSAVILLKFYQFRHPDITAGAHIIFSIISFMLILETVSYYVVSGVYLYLFAITYLILVMLFFTNLYFALYNLNLFDIIRNKQKRKELWNEICHNPCTPGQKSRVVIFIFILLINFILVVRYVNTAYDEENYADCSQALLVIFVANMAGYAVYYVGMKYYYALWKKIDSELISWTCWMYIVLAFGFSITGIYFFDQKEKTTRVSPSLSRHMNANCRLLIFDAHDLWHFTSAFGLLFTFMALLTLEDYNAATPWDDINVF